MENVNEKILADYRLIVSRLDIMKAEITELERANWKLRNAFNEILDMYNDELDNVITYYRSNAILDKEKEFSPDPSSKSLLVFGDNTYKITQKQFLDETMRDDLIPFNIYTYSFSEYSSMKGGNVLMNSIYGCTLINEGQVQSIENLVTENTFTYVAKYARLGHTVTPTEKSVPELSTIKSGSQLLAAYKT